MSYAIINVGGKQYRVREGERLLVDRLALEDGATQLGTDLRLSGPGRLVGATLRAGQRRARPRQ